MSRNAVARDLARHAAETGRPAVELVHTGRHPLRKVRVGDRVQVRAGEVLTIVADVDGGEIPLGQVTAAAAGVFVLDADAEQVLAASRARASR